MMIPRTTKFEVEVVDFPESNNLKMKDTKALKTEVIDSDNESEVNKPPQKNKGI